MSEQVPDRHSGTSRGASRSSQRVTTSSQYIERRFFRLRDKPLGWWPGGLLPLLGLLLLFLWGIFRIAPDMQASTQASVSEVLSGEGYPSMEVAADGQRVSVRGAALEQDTDRIRRMARGATCDTFIADDLICPTHVRVDLSEPENVRFHNISFVRTPEGITLRGEVPDEATRDRLLESARSRFGSAVDSMSITGESMGPAFTWAADKSLAFLNEVQTGRISWMNGILSAVGRTTQDMMETARNAFHSGGFPERLGELELQAIEEVDECNEEFRETLTQSTIRFDTNSSRLSQGNINLLRRLVEVAQNCPGNMVVEGHTDSIGSTSSNISLSMRRANAVVGALTRLGVEDGRLSARGFGEDQPVATNNTSAGRAQNRRIEIKVADIN